MAKRAHKKRRQAAQKTATAAPDTPPDAEVQRAAAVEAASTDELPTFPDWVYLVGGVVLMLLFSFDLEGPQTSASAFARGSTGAAPFDAATFGAIAVFMYALGGQARRWLASYALPAALLLLALAMGTAPDVLHLPMYGVGERMWGFPTALPLPLAGAALFAGGARGRTLGAVCCVVVLAGLLMPFDILGDTRPALFHRLTPFAGYGAGFTLLLTLLCAVGIAAAGFAGRLPTSSLARWSGLSLMAFIPLWELVRATTSHSAVLPTYGLLLASATTLWLAAAVPALLRGLPAPTQKWVPRATEALLLVGLVGIWLLLKSFTWRWSTTDENIYFYDAMLVSEGVMPYRDFFFAHPPMHLVFPALIFKVLGFWIGVAKGFPSVVTLVSMLFATLVTMMAWRIVGKQVGRVAGLLIAALCLIVVPALIFKVLGFSIGVAKAIPVGATLVTAAAIWHIARTRVGRVAGFLTAGLFLFAFDLLQTSSNMNGVNLTSMWLVCGMWALLENRPKLGGALVGLAVTTGFYAIAAALALLVLAFFDRKSGRGLPFLVSFALVAGVINLTFVFIGGDAFIQSVYKYHVLKEAQIKLPEFLQIFYYHTHLAWGLLLAPVLLAWQQYRQTAHPGEEVEPEGRGWFFSPLKLWTEPGVGAIKIAWLVCVTLIVEFTMFKELYSFYFALLFPTAALCTGFVLSGLLGALIHECRELANGRLSLHLAAVAGFLIAWSMWVPMAQESNWIFASRVNQWRGKGVYSEYLNRGELRHYRWVEPAAWTGLAGPVVRTLFWRDHRQRYDMTPGYRRYLWQKSLHLSVAEEVGAYVREHSEPDETIAGSSLVAPAIALTSGRRIAGHAVDTNNKRFDTELYSNKQFFDEICADKLRFLVTANSGYISDRRVKRWPAMVEYFRPVKHFSDPWNKFLKPGYRVWGITLWRVKDAPDGQPRCKWIDLPKQRRRTR